MSTRLKTMKELATIEAKNLKKHLTNEEKENLDNNQLHSWSKKSCIYGLATGNCDSERANILILKCATRIYETTDTELKDFKLNGKPFMVDNRNSVFYSPIELLICDDYGGLEAGEKIIDYLTGETETLNL